MPRTAAPRPADRPPGRSIRAKLGQSERSSDSPRRKPPQIPLQLLLKSRLLARVISPNPHLPVQQHKASAVFERAVHVIQFELVKRQPVEHLLIARQKSPPPRILQKMLPVCRQHRRSIVGWIHTKRNKPRPRQIGRRPLQRPHLLTHQRTRPRAIRKDEIRHPNVPKQSRTIERLPTLGRQLKRPNRPHHRKRSRSLRATRANQSPSQRN